MSVPAQDRVLINWWREQSVCALPFGFPAERQTEPRLLLLPVLLLLLWAPRGPIQERLCSTLLRQCYVQEGRDKVSGRRVASPADDLTRGRVRPEHRPPLVESYYLNVLCAQGSAKAALSVQRAVIHLQ